MSILTLLTSVVTLLLLAVLFSFILCGSILAEKNGNPKLKWLMFLLFIGICLYYLIYILVFTGLIVKFPFFLRGLVPVFYSTQPAIYFYVVLNLDENYTFSKKDLWHFLPAIYSIIDNYGFYAGGPEHWKQLALLVNENNNAISSYRGTLVTAKYNFILRVLLYLTYTLFAWVYYVKNIQYNKNFTEQFVTKWLKYFLILVSLFVVALSFSTIYNSTYVQLSDPSSKHFYMYPLIITSITVIILSSYILFNPILLYGVPRINFNTIADNKNTLSQFSKIDEKELTSSELYLEQNEIQIKELKLAQAIIKEIKELKLYTDTEFSLSKASNHFNLPIHHISFVINKHLQKSFPDIICQMRIEHAINLLKSTSSKKFTMEAIGNMSGFHSRTTFYVNFKKITGISPNEYLQNLKSVN